VLVEGNLFENNWADGQPGYAIVLTPRGERGAAPGATVEDGYNVIRNTGGGLNLLARDDVGPSGTARRIRIADNLVYGGTRHHDLSHLYFHLDLMAARHRQREPILRALQRSKLEGFDPALDARDALFRMMLMQHAVCHVALLAERRVPIVDVAYRWFLKRRWRICERLPERERELRVG
jgi:hypothetical protein